MPDNFELIEVDQSPTLVVTEQILDLVESQAPQVVEALTELDLVEVNETPLFLELIEIGPPGLDGADGADGIDGVSLRAYGFSLPFAVPLGSPKAFLWLDGVATSSAPLLVNKAGSLRGASIVLNKPVAVGSTWILQVLVNGVVSGDTLTLTAGETEKSSVTFSTSVPAGAKIALVLFRSAGSGASAFRRVTVSLELLES